MFRIIGSSIALVGLLLGAAPAAEAHGARHHTYDSHGYYQRGFYRNRHMPRWLWRKRGFRQWYFHTPLRFNHRVSWSRLYDAYRWERRYDFRRSYRLHYGPRHRHYYNNRYWWDYEERERRPKRRQRNRRH